MKSVVFDFDFTLGDSSAAIVECFGYALSGVGLSAPSAHDIRSTIGLPLPKALMRLHGPQSDATTREFVRLYHSRGDEIMTEQTRIYDAVPSVLGTLRERGYRLGIVSTKLRRRIEDILAFNRLHHAIDVIVGSEDTAAHKPDPTGLLYARNRLFGTDNPAIYVGDHPVDGQAASAAGFQFVAMLTGMEVAPRRTSLCRKHRDWAATRFVWKKQRRHPPRFGPPCRNAARRHLPRTFVLVARLATNS